MQTRQLGRAVTVAAALVGLNACVSIPQRAWDNGRAMSARGSDVAFMRGERGFKVMRQTYSSMDPGPFSSYSAVRYPYFGRW
jgi:hypothetical protein